MEGPKLLLEISIKNKKKTKFPVAKTFSDFKSLIL